ncbi:MAG: hypothetical protein U1E42_02845 [Rhodospirillales bacterium]
MRPSPWNKSPVFDRLPVTSPDGQATTVETILSDARVARGSALRHALRTLRLELAALLAPAFGRSRQLRYLP